MKKFMLEGLPRILFLSWQSTIIIFIGYILIAVSSPIEPLSPGREKIANYLPSIDFFLYSSLTFSILISTVWLLLKISYSRARSTNH